MIDDDHDFSACDPANLLPFVCELMLHEQSAEELPRREYNWHV
jgi:hypothetical protein